MKKLTMTLAVLVTVIGTAFAASGDGTMESRAAIYSLKEGTYRVIYGAKEKATVKISILDAEGEMLISDRIKTKEGFMKPYNMEKLEDGVYTIEVTDDYGTIVREVVLGKLSTTGLAAN